MSSSSRGLVPGGRPRRRACVAGLVTSSPLFMSATDDNVRKIRQSMTKREGAAMDPQVIVEADPEVTEDDQVAEQVLVEEVSIDGMCGVY